MQRSCCKQFGIPGSVGFLPAVGLCRQVPFTLGFLKASPAVAGMEGSEPGPWVVL